MDRKLLYSLPCILLTACADAPDKYRDIKHLEMPPTLVIEHTGNTPVEPDVPVKPKPESVPEKAPQSSAKNANSDLEKLILIVGPEEKPRLQLKTRFDRAWDLVNNALSLADIEVVDYNRDSGVIRVRYVDKDNSKGRSFNSSIFSFFSDKFEDVEYTLTIEKDKRITDVRVDKVIPATQATPEHPEAFNNDDTASLVKLLHNTIIADLEK